MEGFARMSSPSHVRIRFAVPAAAAGIQTDGHDPTSYFLKPHERKTSVHLGYTATSIQTIVVPITDPGPYAVVRDGLHERVLQQAVQPPPSVTISHGRSGLTVEPEKGKAAVRMRGPNGRFISTKTGDGAAAVTGQVSGTRAKTGITNEAAKTATGKPHQPTMQKEDFAAPGVKTSRKGGGTGSKKPRGIKVRTKE
jgi:hypothetical protein